MGIEPTTFSLARRRSTDELRPRNLQYTKFPYLPQVDTFSKAVIFATLSL